MSAEKSLSKETSTTAVLGDKESLISNSATLYDLT